MEDRFDPGKDALNREKAGLPLMFGERIFEDPAHVPLPTIRQEDEEDRFKVVGQVEGRLYTAVFT